MSYVELTGYSIYSPLQSTLDVDQIVKLAKEYGMKAVGLTDNNNFYGLFKFYKACQKEGIKPIIGVTLNVSLQDHKIHEGNRAYKIHLIVKDDEGYENINNLITLAQTEGKETGEADSIPKVYYKEVLKRSSGLICMTGGYEGLWNEVITYQGSIENSEWEKLLLEFKNAFGEDFYIEIQDHVVSSELETNVELLRLHEKHGIKIVLTNNYLYANPGEAFSLEVAKSIRSGRNVPRDLRDYVFENYETIDFANDPNFKAFLQDGNSFYFKKPSEVENTNLVKIYPELIANISEIVDKCTMELHLDNPELPNYPLPKGFKTDEEFFRSLVNKGFEKRLPFIVDRRDVNRFPTKEDILTAYRERLDYEMDMICKMGFPGYFLVVWDVCNYARKEGIYMAPGRGSVAGSLVAYCLEITGIDPIAKDLLFERFLNPARVSMPDIDLDFDSQYRSKILDYTYRKYGYDFVAQIISFNTLAAKPAIADVAKVLNLYDESIVPDKKYNVFSDFIKKFINAQKTIKENLEVNEELANMYNSNKTVKFLLDIASSVENSIKTTSMHAGGVVIGKNPISQYIPSQKAKTKKSDTEDGIVLEGVVIQADKKACEPLGLIKMDYLATAILSKIRITLNSINKKLRKQGKKEINFYELCDYVQYVNAKDDPKMYEILQSGNTLMIFQCENPALGNTLTQFYPETFEDVTAILALYRPGPMANIPLFIKNKNYPNDIDFMHEDLKSILKETMGVIVYQEQIMQLVQVWAGFSLAEADLIRRAIGKKEPAVLQAEGEKFVKKAVEMGRDQQLSEHLYQLIVKFAEYGFNKSHAASYAVLALVTAWLKAHYPLEYAAQNMNSFAGAAQKPVERISNYIYNIADMGFEVLPPHINKSDAFFTVEDDKLRHGLFALKGAQEKAVESLVEERNQNGPYKNFNEFIERNVKVIEDDTKEEGFHIETIDRATVESLIQSGAFDEMGKRSELLPIADAIIKHYKKIKTEDEKRKRDAQLDLFSMFDDFVEEVPQYEIPSLPNELQWKEILSSELEKMRVSYSINIKDYIQPIQDKLTFRENFDNIEFKHLGLERKPHLYEHPEKVVCYGMIRAKRELSKSNMCFITFRDHSGIIETTLFSDQYKKYKFFLEQHENEILVFTGKLQRTTYGKIGHESNVYNMNIDEVYTLEEINNNPTLLKHMKVNQEQILNTENTIKEDYKKQTKNTNNLLDLQQQYNLAHIRVGNNLNLKKALKNFFVQNHNQNKDTKVIIHNYIAENIKTDVVVVNNYTISLDDVKQLITNKVISPRDILVTKKVTQ